MTRWNGTILQGLLLLALSSSCNDEAGEGEHDSSGSHHNGNDTQSKGMSTGAQCPSDSTLSYESFGKPFMDKYCVSCHSSTLTGPARNGAPDGHDFDREAGILPVAEHIDQFAASGPQATNLLMPPIDPKPTDEERKQLGEWLACEASSNN